MHHQRRQPDLTLTPAPSRLRPWGVVLAVCLIYLGVIWGVNDFDTKVFVTLGDCYSTCQFDAAQGCADGTEKGYDGQFAYYIARNPAHAAGCMDVAAYRYQRILLPMLGYLLSFGVTSLIPVIFVAVNLAALVIGVAILESLLVDLGASRWYALSYGLFFGTLAGVRLSTAEPLAYGLFLGALLVRQRRPQNLWLPPLLLLLAVLTKETVAVLVAGFVLYEVLQRRWRAALLMAAIVGIPFIAWQGYLYSWLGSFGVGSGGRDATSFEFVPYYGVLRIYTETESFRVFLLLGALVIPLAVLPGVWGLWAILRVVWRTRTCDLWICLHLANVIVLMTVPFSTYREFLGLFRFMPPLILTHLLFTARYYPRRPLLYSTLWCTSLIFMVSG